VRRGRGLSNPLEASAGASHELRRPAPKACPRRDRTARRVPALLGRMRYFRALLGAQARCEPAKRKECSMKCIVSHFAVLRSSQSPLATDEDREAGIPRPTGGEGLADVSRRAAYHTNTPLAAGRGRPVVPLRALSFRRRLPAARMAACGKRAGLLFSQRPVSSCRCPPAIAAPVMFSGCRSYKRAGYVRERDSARSQGIVTADESAGAPVRCGEIFDARQRALRKRTSGRLWANVMPAAIC